MSENKVVIGGSVIPSISDAPMDIRTRVNTIDDIYNIELPYIGMIIYVINEDKYYKIKTLKAKEIAGVLIENSLVDTFEELLMPNFTGALSLNRKADTEIGKYSSTLGYNCTASGNRSHAEGFSSIASGHNSHAEGQGCDALGLNSHAEGCETNASGSSAHAEGLMTIATGYASHAEGYWVYATGDYQHVQGKRNIEDTENRYAHIVGNGSEDFKFSNAHTLDWDGNAWFQGDVFIQGASQDDGLKLATEDMVITSQEKFQVSNEFIYRDKIVEMAKQILQDCIDGIAWYSQTYRTTEYTKPNTIKAGNGTGKIGYDETSLISCCYMHAGLDSMYAKSCSGGTLVKEIQKGGKMIPCNSENMKYILPGDILLTASGTVTQEQCDSLSFITTSHAAIYIGDNKIIHAKGSNYGIQESDMDYYLTNDNYFFVRPADLINTAFATKQYVLDSFSNYATEDMVIALQQEIAELRAIIEELKNK